MRQDLFLNTLKKIESENSNPENTYKVGINKFADWTVEEYRSILTYHSNSFSHDYLEINETIPSSIDWRKEGAVTTVKD